jgi:hypothetical protein
MAMGLKMDIGRVFITGIVAGFAVAASLAPLRAAEPTVAGFWQQADDEGTVGGWFLLFERDGLVQGALVRGFPKPGETPITVCTKCNDEQKNAPMLGLIIIKGMQRKGLIYENGTILDPRDGSVYRAKLELSPDGKTMTVRGFLGIELFGQSQTWKRLPDNAVARADIPENLRPYLPATVPAGAMGPKPGGNANSKNMAPGANSKSVAPVVNSKNVPPIRQ